ncbi:MAG: 6-pyruvoyl tetrahydropterin synthase family protein [Candidatus Hodarchaeota archaeon]
MPVITLNYDKLYIGFSAAHILSGFGKCDRLHGHNYQVSVNLRGEMTNEALIDFQELKQILSEVCSQLDHKILLPYKSKKLMCSFTSSTVEVKVGEKEYSFPMNDVQLLDIKSTTCENLAIWLYERLKKRIAPLELRIRLEETPGSACEYGDF